MARTNRYHMHSDEAWRWWWNARGRLVGRTYSDRRTWHPITEYGRSSDDLIIAEQQENERKATCK